MPKAKPPLAPVPPAPLKKGEANFIKEVVERHYGADAVIRNFGPDPAHLSLHVEASKVNANGPAEWLRIDCLGELMTRIDRRRIDLVVTKRGGGRRGAKIAYRQGVIV